jgi:hypothetical protein
VKSPDYVLIKSSYKTNKPHGDFGRTQTRLRTVRQGIANLKGQPHFYDCVFDESQGGYTNLYRLTPITRHIFDLAIEDWGIWQRWELAFHTGRTALESHPALPQDRTRHEEIMALLGSAPKTDPDTSIIRVGAFEVIGTPKLPKGVLRPLQVKWTEPNG